MRTVQSPPNACFSGMSPFLRLSVTSLFLSTALFCLIFTSGSTVSAAEGSDNPSDRLTPAQWQKIDTAVDRGLKYIAANQQADGSFMAPRSGQPGITSIAIMAFLSRGYTPQHGPYGKQLDKAISFVLASQQSSGIISTGGSRPNYHHAISSLMLGEAYGQTSGPMSDRIKTAIEKALAYSRMRQTLPKRNAQDKGGWRYHRPYGPNDSDLTASAWNLMFYRSAKNAGFDVPQEYVEDAMGYIKRSFDPEIGGFVYTLNKSWTEEYYASGATVAGGIVSLAMAGEHNTPMAREAGAWILKHPFTSYNRRQHPDDRYHYSAYYCSQAMFLLGGDYWDNFFPEYLEVITSHQRSTGAWDREARHESNMGDVYTTSLMVLSLTPPYQMLPIYQR
ncbi:MAG: terpene cyclase/mutase family protein [Planctomycetaceae bacterium]|nr:terpene cyclase/mutase family protein [Planctomycetaceae bacterium]